MRCDDIRGVCRCDAMLSPRMPLPMRYDTMVVACQWLATRYDDEDSMQGADAIRFDEHVDDDTRLLRLPMTHDDAVSHDDIRCDALRYA